jgi:hypothetical protein
MRELNLLPLIGVCRSFIVIRQSLCRSKPGLRNALGKLGLILMPPKAMQYFPN